MDYFFSLPLVAIFAISLVVIGGAIELGRFLGRRSGDGADDNVGTMEGAVLGLLALMISFTFAMALTRYDARRDAILTEANDIGTAALRARLLPAPHHVEVLNLLREYTGIRLDLRHTRTSEEAFRAAVARSADIHEALWQQAKAVAAKDSGMVPTGLFIQALNAVIDDQEKRLTAYRTRVPQVVLAGLYAIAMTALGFTGYASGVKPAGSRAPAYMMGVLVAGVILLIQDLDRPGAGYIQASMQPLIDTAQSMAGYEK